MTAVAPEIIVTFELPPEIDVTFESPPPIVVTFSETSLPGPQGIQGIQGIQGVSGDGVAFFQYIQSAASATWIIEHNLGFFREPTVVLDSDPTRPVWADVEHGTINQTTIIFPSPVTGRAYF